MSSTRGQSSFVAEFAEKFRKSDEMPEVSQAR